MLDRTIAPAFHSLTVPTLNRPDIRQFSNGSQLALFLSDDQHLVALDLVFPASSLQTQKRQMDLYAFKMLLEGTKQRTSKKLADDISFLGASFDISHSADYETISISCLSRFLPKVLDIFKEMWAESIFPSKEWQTIQETGTQHNAINLQKTAFLAGKALRQQLYTSAFDYGYSYDPALVASISSEMLQTHFQELQPVGPALAILAGKADEATISQIGNWISGFAGIQLPGMGSIQVENPKPGIIWEAKADSQQSSLRIGQFAINSQHVDSPMFNLTLEIFGGYFGSRLMSNIREDKGWTYGVFAQRVAFLAQPYWVIGSDVKGDIVLDAVAEIQKEAEIMRTEAVESDELDKVKNYMLGQFLSSITNCYGVADRYKSVWLNGIDFDRVENNLRTIQNATPEQVLSISQKYLKLDQAVVALSGNPV